MVSRADLTTLPTLKMPSNSSLLCMVNTSLSCFSALRAGSFFLKWTIACESGCYTHSMFLPVTCQSCGMRRLRRTMNEKYFIHLVSMQLASILTRLARLSGIAAMSFLRSLNLWGAVVVVAFVALVPMGLAEAQEREKPVEILDATQGNYRLVVNVLPRVPAVGPINFTVFPTSAKDGTPIRDAKITLVSHDAEGVPTYQVKALNTPSDSGRVRREPRHQVGGGLEHPHRGGDGRARNRGVCGPDIRCARGGREHTGGRTYDAAGDGGIRAGRRIPLAELQEGAGSSRLVSA